MRHHSFSFTCSSLPSICHRWICAVLKNNNKGGFYSTVVHATRENRTTISPQSGRASSLRILSPCIVIYDASREPPKKSEELWFRGLGLHEGPAFHRCACIKICVAHREEEVKFPCFSRNYSRARSFSRSLRKNSKRFPKCDRREGYSRVSVCQWHKRG